MRRKLLYLVSVGVAIHVVGSWVLAAGWAIWFAMGLGLSVPITLIRFVSTAPFVPNHYSVMSYYLTQAINDPQYEGVAFPLGPIIIATWAAWLLAVASICFVGFRLYRGGSLRRQGVPLRSKKRGFEAVSVSEPPPPKSA